MKVNLSNFFIMITLWGLFSVETLKCMSEQSDGCIGASYIKHIISNPKFTHSSAVAMGYPETLNVSGLTFNCENVFYERIYDSVHILYVYSIDSYTYIRFLISINVINYLLPAEERFYKLNIEKFKTGRAEFIRCVYILPESIDKDLNDAIFIKMAVSKIEEVIDDFKQRD